MELKDLCTTRRDTCVKRCFVTVLIGLATSITFPYLWNAGHKCLVTTTSLFSLGVAYFYWTVSSRDKLTPKQVIVITGCDSGLGYSLALHCRLLGATVVAGVLNASSPSTENLTREGIHVYHLDVLQERSVEKFGSEVRALLERERLVLRALINNAGVMIFGEFEWQTESQVRHQIEVNLLGTMRVTRELMPVIRSNRSRLILITSHCSSQPLPGVAVYGATKAAMSAWATALRVELKKYGIKVVCFVPGSFTRESNLLAQQGRHFEAMRASMSDEAKAFYGDYFDRYSRYFSPMAREVGPKKIENPHIYSNFEGALLDRYPSAVYKCEPWRYFFYHTLFKITPTCMRDRLIEMFVQLPSWKDKGADKKSMSSIQPSAEQRIPKTDQSDFRVIGDNETR